jgi:hypothetical protein
MARRKPLPPDAWYDPRNGRRVGFPRFLVVADAIARQADRDASAYEAARSRVTEGVPKSRARYWNARLALLAANSARSEGWWRQIEAQLARETEEPPDETAVEYEVGLDYSSGPPSAAVDINIRFGRRDGAGFGMAEAWGALNAFRAAGEFPPVYWVNAIDWLGAASKRRGRPRSAATDAAQIQAAVTDFYGIIHAGQPGDFRLGAVKT